MIYHSSENWYDQWSNKLLFFDSSMIDNFSLFPSKFFTIISFVSCGASIQSNIFHFSSVFWMFLKNLSSHVWVTNMIFHGISRWISRNKYPQGEQCLNINENTMYFRMGQFQAPHPAIYFIKKLHLYTFQLRIFEKYFHTFSG